MDKGIILEIVLFEEAARRQKLRSQLPAQKVGYSRLAPYFIVPVPIYHMKAFPFLMVLFFIVFIPAAAAQPCLTDADMDCDGSVNGKPGVAVGALPCA